MEITTINTETDYQAALTEVERLFHAPTGTPDAELLESLVTLIEAYEARHYPIPEANPIAATKYYMESRDKAE